MNQQISGFIGPTIPSTLIRHSHISQNELICSNKHNNIDTDRDHNVCQSDGSNDEDYLIGPMPSNLDAKQISLINDIEDRARKMKDKLVSKNLPVTNVANRETWMLELPPELSKNFGISERKFRKNAALENIDRTLWTETPLDRAKRELGIDLPATKPKKDKCALEMATIIKNDVFMKEVEKYNKLKRRKKSLLELHQEKLYGKKEISGQDSSSDSSIEIKKKHKKKKHKKSSSKYCSDSEKPRKSKDNTYLDKQHKSKTGFINSLNSKCRIDLSERRPFDRDVDLKVNRFDDAQRQKLIKKSQVLNSKFGHGKSHFL